jgi:Glycosyl hydrolase family 85
LFAAELTNKSEKLRLTISSFSHHRITIPPVNFTNTCHRNNLLSLGTFIVEWQEGISELEKFLLGASTDVELDKENTSKDMWNPHYADKLGNL